MWLRDVWRKSTNTLQGPVASFFRIQHTVTSSRHQYLKRFLLQILRIWLVFITRRNPASNIKLDSLSPFSKDSFIDPNPKLAESSPLLHVSYCNIHFNIILPSTLKSTPFLLKFCLQFLSSTCVLLFISSRSKWSGNTERFGSNGFVSGLHSRGTRSEMLSEKPTIKL